MANGVAHKNNSVSSFTKLSNWVLSDEDFLISFTIFLAILAILFFIIKLLRI